MNSKYILGIVCLLLFSIVGCSAPVVEEEFAAVEEAPVADPLPLADESVEVPMEEPIEEPVEVTIEEPVEEPGPESVQEEPIDLPETVSKEELASHNTPSDCWVAYEGVVYSISDYLPAHPDGGLAIEDTCGTDDAFTDKFVGKHGTAKVNVLESEGEYRGMLE